MLKTEDIEDKLEEGWILCVAKDPTKNASYLMNDKHTAGTFLSSEQVAGVIDSNKICKVTDYDIVTNGWPKDVYDIYRGVKS